MFCESYLVCGLVVVGGYRVFSLHPIQGWSTFIYILVIFRLFHLMIFIFDDFILFLVLFLEVDRWLDLLLFWFDGSFWFAFSIR